MAVHSQTYDSLYLSCLTPESHARTCGYWYTVTTTGGTPHTAFRTRDALLSWLNERNLTVDFNIPPEGTFAAMRINGAYRSATNLGSYDEFFTLDGQRSRIMSNGEITLAIITRDADGLRTVHYLNPNMRDRPVFDRECGS